MLFAIHGMMAAGFKTPELALEKDESKELAQAMANVNAFYGKVIDPKVFAWIGLIGVAGKLYGPRVMAIKLRKSMEEPARPQRQPLRPVPAPQAQNVGTNVPTAATNAQPFNPMPFNPAINPLN